jgi:hypothetical protein
VSTSFSIKDQVDPAKNSGRDKEKFTSQTTLSCQSIFYLFCGSARETNHLATARFPSALLRSQRTDTSLYILIT